MQPVGGHDALVLAIGFCGQALFSARFLVQWIASERSRRSVVPVVFWYLSMAGGVTLLAYAIARADPVFMVGQGFGLLVYGRNLWLIWRASRAAATQPGPAAAQPGPAAAGSAATRGSR